MGLKALPLAPLERAFAEIEATALDTKSVQPFFSVSINPPAERDALMAKISGGSPAAKGAVRNGFAKAACASGVERAVHGRRALGRTGVPER
ncbi:hypothetical protein [Actibacterium mucosum]|uniref:hypothetical protein n=1 Tax=Actibacterium mucosum TaxID=1087332 RepID=UPI001267BCB8|nr:hypothetical protein [Actibacterium mucosum]